MMFGGRGGIRPNLQAEDDFASGFTTIEEYLSLAWMGINILRVSVEVLVATLCMPAYLYTTSINFWCL